MNRVISLLFGLLLIPGIASAATITVFFANAEITVPESVNIGVGLTMTNSTYANIINANVTTNITARLIEGNDKVDAYLYCDDANTYLLTPNNQTIEMVFCDLIVYRRGTGVGNFTIGINE